MTQTILANQLVNLLNFITQNPGATEKLVARRYYNGRILPARQALQSLLWSGHILPATGGYRAAPLKVACVDPAPSSDMTSFFTAYNSF